MRPPVVSLPVLLKVFFRINFSVPGRGISAFPQKRDQKDLLQSTAPSHRYKANVCLRAYRDDKEAPEEQDFAAGPAQSVQATYL